MLHQTLSFMTNALFTRVTAEYIFNGAILLHSKLVRLNILYTKKGFCFLFFELHCYVVGFYC